MLADQTGMGHELYYYTASPAIVLVTCGGRRRRFRRGPSQALNKVRDTFKGKNVEFMMLDSSLKSPHDEFVGTPGSADLPVLADELQLVGRALGVTTTAEVFVIETKTWTGRVSRPDRRFVRAQKNKKANLSARSNAVLDGKPVPVSRSGREGHAGRLPRSRARPPSSRRSTTQRRSRRSSPTSASPATRRAAWGRSR